MSNKLTLENSALRSELSKSISETCLITLYLRSSDREHKINRRLLRSKYESTMQKFLTLLKCHIAGGSTMGRNEASRFNTNRRNSKAHISNLETMVQKTKDSLMKANMRIDRFLSKRELIQEYENLSHPKLKVQVKSSHTTK